LKKFLLASFVVLTFALYSFHQRHDGSGIVVKPPPSLTQGSSHTSGSSSSPSTTSSPSSSTNTNSSPAQSSTTQTTVAYKDGQYTGSVADAFYGNIQVKAIIQGGKITDVQFLQYPNDRSNSIRINQQADPYLTQEAIQAQSAQVDIVSGATDSSQAFIQSLSAALTQAKN